MSLEHQAQPDLPRLPAPEPRPRVAVVVPCYRVKRHVRDVIAAIGPEVTAIYVVDDACPEGTGRHVEETETDPRVRVVSNERNQGVGGATMAGIARALADGADVIVKLDGDGQMDPRLVPKFVRPILEGDADFTKGNRFFNLEDVASMPRVRLLGNAALSFLSKLSTGYWHTFDPTNGYIAIHAKVAAALPMTKISRRYFFETDLLFRLNTIRAVVVDVPMVAVYGDEVSGLDVRTEVLRFAWGHLKNFGRRIFYNYYLRNFGFASLELLVGALFLAFGVGFGGYQWVRHARAQEFASSGTVILAALPVIVGTQLLLGFVHHDIESVPTLPIHKRL
jgi:glycosyltransferase involved in cell wall biosynthesis